MPKKIYMVCGMVVTEEEFNRVCKDEGVSDFPQRRLKPKMFPCDKDEFEVDPGPWQEVEDGHSYSRMCHTGDKVLVDTIVKEG